MNDPFSPFEYPEVIEIFKKLFDKLFDESERGSIIIATSHIEDHLTKYIESVLPDKTVKYKKKLFKYPGSLSSFSAKIELSYAFGLIDKNLYNRLNNLRKIRNDASHESSVFSLSQLKDQIMEVYNLGPHIPEQVKQQSIKMMMKIKLESMNYIFDEHDLSIDDRKEIASQVLKDKKIIESLEKQLPHWELLYGTCLLCGIITYEKDKRLRKK